MTYTFWVRASDVREHRSEPGDALVHGRHGCAGHDDRGRPSGVTTGTAPSFTFAAEAGATFECKLDTPAGAGSYAACTSPPAYTTTVNGAYTFSVRASDAAGNTDATPATRSFTITAPTASPGDLDASFSDDGKQITDFGGLCL